MIHRVFGAFKRQSTINRTVRELSRLSDRELSDVGISRGDIQSVASRVGI